MYEIHIRRDKEVCISYNQSYMLKNDFKLKYNPPELYFGPRIAPKITNDVIKQNKEIQEILNNCMAEDIIK